MVTKKECIEMCEYTEHNRITPIKVRPEMKIKIFNNRELEQVHHATLTVLEEVGIRFPSQKALEIFAEAGACVDFNAQIVKIPPDLLMSALSRAPRAFIMASRGDPELDLQINGKQTYFGTDGTGTTTVDIETRKRRASTKKDLEMMTIISDYLPSISLYLPLVAAQDVPAPVIPLHELEAAFTNTEKHIIVEEMGVNGVAPYILEMVSAIAGSREEMQKRPPFSAFACTVAPLGQDRGGIEAILTYAEAGLPVGFMSMPSMCSTGPASLAGTLVVGNAEVLSACCLIQLACPGNPVFYSIIPGFAHPYTGGFLVSAPYKTVLNVAPIQLAHYYNLPTLSGTFGSTNAHRPDSWKAGMEVSRDPILASLAGADFSLGLGLLETYTLLYPEKILYDNEIFNTMKIITEGIEVNSETLAIDEIRAVGPRGHFLNRDYTKNNLQKIWMPGIVHQWSPKTGDFKDPQEAALEKAKWILSNHEPKPLEDKVKKELMKITDAAEKKLIT
jgi:trimethylamine--corrinoid protein Co-methyltransferase